MVPCVLIWGLVLLAYFLPAQAAFARVWALLPPWSPAVGMPWTSWPKIEEGRTLEARTPSARLDRSQRQVERCKGAPTVSRATGYCSCAFNDCLCGPFPRKASASGPLARVLFSVGSNLISSGPTWTKCPIFLTRWVSSLSAHVLQLQLSTHLHGEIDLEKTGYCHHSIMIFSLCWPICILWTSQEEWCVPILWRVPVWP